MFLKPSVNTWFFYFLWYNLVDMDEVRVLSIKTPYLRLFLQFEIMNNDSGFRFVNNKLKIEVEATSLDEGVEKVREKVLSSFNFAIKEGVFIKYLENNGFKMQPMTKYSDNLTKEVGLDLSSTTENISSLKKVGIDIDGWSNTNRIIMKEDINWL